QEDVPGKPPDQVASNVLRAKEDKNGGEVNPQDPCLQQEKAVSPVSDEVREEETGGRSNEPSELPDPRLTRKGDEKNNKKEMRAEEITKKQPNRENGEVGPLEEGKE
ncbi:Hypothetical protein FKW44_003942, partial [Caligus rogercresseyi]